MTDKYCPRIEIKKLEVELRDLKVKGTDVIGYNQRFQELALLCVRMFPEESDKIERYVGGLPDMIHGSVVASKPKTMQEATEIAPNDDKAYPHFLTDRQNENKTKEDNNSNNTTQNKRRHDRALSCWDWGVTVGHAGTNPDSNVVTGNETLIVYGDGSNRGNEARLHIISYTKTQEYILKGCPVFLANITTKETKDKSEKKRLEDVSIVQDFPDVFPEELPGLPPTRQVEFQIDLIPGVAPVAL
ncbi:hypothetical protein Tco_0067157 [Tanacetum coccineum]